MAFAAHAQQIKPTEDERDRAEECLLGYIGINKHFLEAGSPQPIGNQTQRHGRRDASNQHMLSLPDWKQEHLASLIDLEPGQPP